MKLHGALRSITALALLQNVNSQCVEGGFDLIFDGYCNYANILDKFTDFFANPVNVADGCTNTAEQELVFLLGGGDINATVRDICKESVDNFPSMHFDDIPRLGPDFIREYYDGNTIWNEEHETKYPLDDNGNPTNILRSQNGVYGDAGRVQNVYEGEAQYGVLDWPGHLTNFELDTCAMNAAMCCWPSDRQANDNNGNCAKEYDANCEDSDPSDNTDLCYVDLEKGVLSTGYTGTGVMTFEGDDGSNQHSAEGPIHCHGFAWANDESDFTSSYKANNLFYVSMYDHMTQRGYVRNIQGAPMCGCLEQMPVASRSDCTQVDVEEQFQITYDGTQWSGNLVKVYIDFNACQGFDRDGGNDNNDLWSYMNRLYREDKVTLDQLIEIGKYLVGDQPNMCYQAIADIQLQKGIDRGHNVDEDSWYEVAGNYWLEIDSPMGPLSFDEAFADSPNGIILRRCLDCKQPYHRKVYYKRITEVKEGFNHYDYLLNKNVIDAENFVYGTDFLIYSTYEDAVAGVNEWDCDNYNYGQYFPGSCRPNGTSGENNAGGRLFPQSGKRNIAWYIEKSTDTSVTREKLEATTIGYSNYPGSTRLIDDKIYMTAFGSFKNGEQYYQSETHSDVEMTVSVDELYYKHGWARAGLMIRSSLEPNAPLVAFSLTGTYGLQMFWGSNGQYHERRTARTSNGAEKLKLTKTANLFRSYYYEEDPSGANVALGKSASQSSQYASYTTPDKALDGNTSGEWSHYSLQCTHSENGAWWKVNLDGSFPIHTVKLFNRNTAQERLRYFYVQLLDSDGNVVSSKYHDSETRTIYTFEFEDVDASQVRIIFKSGYTNYLTMAEVQVWSGHHESEGDPWKLFWQTNFEMTETIHNGLFLNANRDNEPAEVIFSDYTEEQYTYPSAAPSVSLAPTIVLPSRDVGNIGLAGYSSVASGGRYDLAGSGRDISQRDDGFHFLNYPRANDDFIITAHIDSFDYSEEWSKAGIMARTFLCNESPMVFMGLTGTRGFIMVWREYLDAHTAHNHPDTHHTANSGWVQIRKYGEVYTGYYKLEEQDDWTVLSTVTLQTSKEPEMHAGLVVSSHDNAKLSHATFSDLLIEDVNE